MYNVCHVNNDSVGNLVLRRQKIRKIIGKIRKNVILIDNLVQSLSLYLFCTYGFNPGAGYLQLRIQEYGKREASDFIPTNVLRKSETLYYIFLRQSNRAVSYRPNETWRIVRREIRFSNPSLLSSRPPRVTTRGSRIWSILAVTFEHLLSRTPARIRPGDEKRGRKGPMGSRRKGRVARGKGEKGRIRPGKKEAEKKNTTHPADGGRPVRLVLDLKPRVYPPSFFLYLYASPAPRPASHPPWRPFPLREDLSRRAVAITIVFASLLRALPATVPVVAMYIP